ncbi:ATP-binding cassette domain-containing protein [Glutamicibacter ardleyensis]|uniref:ATP-binding cassette domain-containing protein n=1 Tax=Glutamicibacter ardleyensis TaxID=225894 RepID=UPI003FD46014
MHSPKPCINKLTFRAGERWLVSGANAAGKTTLWRVLAGEPPVDGGITFYAPELSVR